MTTQNENADMDIPWDSGKTQAVVQKAGKGLAPTIGQVPASQMVEVMNKLVNAKFIKREVNELEVNLVLYDIYKKWKSLPTPDVVEFFYLCMTTGARPLAKDIYLIPYNQSVKDASGNWVKVPKGQTVFSYNFFNKCAELSSQYGGIQVESQWVKEMTETGEEKPRLKATCKAFRKGCEQPFSSSVYFDEVAQVDKNDKPKGLWGTAKHMMTEKCAVARTIRLAYPNAMGGFYTEEELGTIFKSMDPRGAVQHLEDAEQAIGAFNNRFREIGEKKQEITGGINATGTN